MDQEKIIRINMLSQESENIEKHLEAIDEQSKELENIKSSLENIKENNTKEILTNLGKGIFVKAELKNKELFINVGGNVILKKNPNEGIEIIEAELNKMSDGRKNLILRFEEIREEIERSIAELQANSCDNEDCECERDCGDNCKCKKEHKH